MPTAFCSLDDAYGDWGKTVRKYNAEQAKPKETEKTEKDTSALNAYNGSEGMSDIRSFCPNCQNCLNANNKLQQAIIEQNIWPRPRWIPQYPQAYESYDPYNRYWMNHWQNGIQRREDFGGPIGSLFNIEHFGNLNNTEGLLQIILVILVILFIIQLFEIIFKLSSN